MINTKNERLITAFGKRIRSLREERKMSMEKLAALAGVEYSQIAKIETGKINTTISTASVLAKALKISLSELFNIKI